MFSKESKFRVFRDDCGDPTIRCLRGHIYEHGPETLGYSGKTRGWRDQLLAIPGVVSWQTGDQEFSVIFPVSALPEVAKVVKPKRKRVLSQVERTRLAAYAFKRAS